MFRKVVFVLVAIGLYSCNSNRRSVAEIVEHIHSHEIVDTIVVKEYDDTGYPDNPDIGFTHSKYGEVSHKKMILTRKKTGEFMFQFLPSNMFSDTITFENIDITNMMPKVAKKVIDSDDYLSFIGIVNQEWNRHQVRFNREQEHFRFNVNQDKPSFEHANVTRIDIARNCLNSGLWEIIAYAKDGDKVKTYYHGWFDFPMDIYAEEFERLNPTLVFEDLRKNLVYWEDPEMEVLALDKLRTRKDTVTSEVNNYNHKLYAETGARRSKKKNIIAPQTFEVIQDFLSDSTVYSTFSPPGHYRTDDPRKTTLGKMFKLESAKVFSMSSPIDSLNNELKEIELIFTDSSKENRTTLHFGGLDFSMFPKKGDSTNHQGYKYPMGISNHSFYETYEQANANPVDDNPYFGVLYNEKQEWIDSHYFGIDGPLFYWDENEEDLLHLYILAFERHSYVGHYTFKF